MLSVKVSSQKHRCSGWSDSVIVLLAVIHVVPKYIRLKKLFVGIVKLESWLWIEWKHAELLSVSFDYLYYDMEIAPRLNPQPHPNPIPNPKLPELPPNGGLVCQANVISMCQRKVAYRYVLGWRSSDVTRLLIALMRLITALIEAEKASVLLTPWFKTTPRCTTISCAKWSRVLNTRHEMCKQ